MRNLIHTDDTPKQTDTNVTSLITKITVASKEVLLEEIRKHLVFKEEMEVLETSVSEILRKRM